jgi:hypothetical protein
MTDTNSSRDWRLFDVSFFGDVADPDRATTPWSGHRWFGYDLVRWLEPKRFVELGTHWGCSFFALTQAVLDGDLQTECHSVDTWEGDPDAGFYGPEVYESFSSIVGTWLRSVDIRIHRMTFDKALPTFEDESIDLLHIDGYHSYEAVSHDFETWLPKVAPNGIVLFHDVNPDSEYGSAIYWKKLQEEYPGFAFPHNFGLGVLFPKGVAGREYLLSDEFQKWRGYYTERAGNALGRLQFLDQAGMIEERDRVIAHQARMIDARDQALAAQARMIDDRDEALTAQTQMIDERDRVISGQNRLLEGVEVPPTDPVGHGQDDPEVLESPAEIEQTTSLKERMWNAGSRAPEPVPTWLLKSRRRYWEMKDGRPADAGTGSPATDVVEGEEEASAEATPGFDQAFYAAFNNDVDLTSIDPFRHYLESGIREGRPPTRRALTKAAVEVVVDEAPPTRHQPLLYQAPDQERQSIHQLSQVPLDEIGLVTLDFWQTLVIRRRPAESVKLDSARFMSQMKPVARAGLAAREVYQARLAAESELATERRTDSGWGEYRAEEALLRSLALLLPGLPDDQSRALAGETVRREVAIEIAYATLNLELASWVNGVADQGIEFAIISDFYLDSAALTEILASTGFIHPIPFFVSCEKGVSKSGQGELLKLVRTEMEVDAKRHLHIGDNPYSDFEMQVSTGGAALLIPTPADVEEARDHHGLDPDQVSDLFRKGRQRQRRHQTLPKLEDLLNDGDLRSYLGHRAFGAGAEMASLPTLLVLKALESARSEGVVRVNYLSREGSLLRRIHEAVSDTVGMSDILAVHLPSSRQSTFSPSIEDPDADLHRLWSFYRHQSPNEFLAALGMDPSRFRSRLEAHGLDPDVKLWTPWEEPAFVSFLEHRSVAQELEGSLESQRKAAREFLDDAFGPDEVSVVADIGWRGTIQDNLARLFAEREFRGLYLGLLDFLNPQPGNSSKAAIGPDANTGDDVSWLEDHVAVLERLLTPPIASTVGYGGGQGVVLRNPNEQISSILAAFQDGVLAGAVGVAEVYVKLGAEVSDFKAAVVEDMRRAVLQPPGGVADAFFSSAHSDDFGHSGPDTSVALRWALERLARSIGRGQDPPALDDLYWPAGLRRAFAVEVALAGWW